MSCHNPSHLVFPYPYLFYLACLLASPLAPRFARGSLTPVLGIWFFAAVGSLTAASRCTWAFSRDGGIPFSQWWRVVNHRHDVPLNALILSTIVCALLGLIYLGSSAAFNAFTGVATICLGCSYAFPILCSLLRRRAMVRGAPYSLGKFGWAIVSCTAHGREAGVLERQE